MISTFYNYLESTSLSSIFETYWNTLVLYLTDCVNILRHSQTKTLTKVVEKFPNTIYFDDFQWKLLITFSIILAINLLLITILWRIYGKSISQRFMKLSTQREIEELKASVSKLKLPKEHTPRL